MWSDLIENWRPVDNSPGAAERAGEVYKRQEFSAESDESETGLSSARVGGWCIAEMSGMCSVLLAVVKS